MSAVDIACLGPMTLKIDGRPVAVGGPKQRAVLAMLVLHVGEFVSVDQLTDVVWGTSPPRNPRGVLQVYVTNLRRMLGDDHSGSGARLANSGGGYRLSLDTDAVDWLRFDRLTQQAEKWLSCGELGHSADLLRSALELWHGSAFPDLTATEFPPPAISRLEDRRVNAIEDLLELDLATGRSAEVAARSAELVAEYPFRERIRIARVTALYRCARLGEALAACRAARQFLLDELGAEPGQDFIALEQAVLQQDPVRQRTPGETTRAGIDRIPAAVSSFIGRTVELADLRTLLAEGHSRLITLTGPGGTGKTRLAMAAATAARPRFAHGVCWVALDAITGADRVAGAIAEELGLMASAGQDLLPVIADHLRSRMLLLVLDNFEHVMDAWPIVATILRAAPDLTVLITSRIALEISGEQRFAVPRLAVPPTTAPPCTFEVFDSVRLFIARARQVNRGFTIDEDSSAEPVAEVCRRLDGIPLAIELAAAQTADHSPAELLRSLRAVLTVLVDGPRDVPDRHRTLRATIEWSHRRLDEPQQSVFAALGVFAGAPDRLAVKAIVDNADSADTVDSALAGLVRQSLLLMDAAGSEPRFQMLQIVRAFAREMLAHYGRELPTSRRHAEHYLGIAQTQSDLLHSPGQIEAFAVLQQERVEFDSALDWAAGIHGDGGDNDLALRLVGSLWDFWQSSGDVAVPRQRAVDALARDTSSNPTVRAAAASGAGTLCWLTGDLASASHWHSEALANYCLIGDGLGIAWSTLCLAVQRANAGEYGEAERMAQQSLRLAVDAGAVRVVGGAHTALGVLAIYRGDDAAAQDHQQRALAIARETGDGRDAAKALINLSDIAEGRGNWRGAIKHVVEALEISARLGDRVNALFAVEAMAELKLRLGSPRLAARLLAAARLHRAAMAHPLDAHEQAAFEDVVDQTRGAAGPVGFAVAWAEGESLSFVDTIAAALA